MDRLQQLENQFVQMVRTVEIVEKRCEELSLRLQVNSNRVSDTENQVEPEVYLIKYLVSLPENKIRELFCILVPVNDEETSFLFYKKFVEALRVDDGFLPKNKVVSLLKLLMSSYEKVLEFSEERNQINDFLDSESDFCSEF